MSDARGCLSDVRMMLSQVRIIQTVLENSLSYRSLGKANL